ncbi:MAG: nuclear transport factor 2 family protein [Bacteroidales bacterium]
MKKILFGTLVISLIFSCNHNKVEFNRELAIIELNAVMDNWHLAAAIADEKTFFNTMDKNAVYLGTDPAERWFKHEFEDWAMPFFNRDTAWAFKSYNRYWEFSKSGEIAWFDELLETHMGICRGSGVLQKFDDGWKIKQYNLALTLENEKMNEFRVLQGLR